jgi:cobalt-zinc-cadmium efflux system membrane fusion protein
MSKLKNSSHQCQKQPGWRRLARSLGLVLTGGMLLVTGSGCGSGQKEILKPSQSTVQRGPQHFDLTSAQERSLGIVMATVHRMNLTDKVSCNGQIEAVSALQAEIFTPAKGRVLEIPVNLGQMVSAGQLMASIKSDDVGQLQSDLLQQSLQADADIRQAKVQLDFSKAAYNREAELFKEGVSAKADMDNARQQYRKDLETLNAAQIKRRASMNASLERLSLYGVSRGAGARVLKTQRISPYLSVRSPRSGVVVARNVNVGELADTSKTLFTVADLREVWIGGDVYEKDINKVRVGQPIEIELEDQPDAPFAGRVNFVSSVLKPQTRTMEVRGEIPNVGLKLKPNMFARMAILVGSRNVMAVPSNAVEKLGDYNYVFVNKGTHTYEERKVKVGADNGDYIEILGGLQENERVVIQGTTGLKGLVMKMASDTGE